MVSGILTIKKICPWTHLVKVLLRQIIAVEFKLEHNQMGSSGFPVRGIIAFVHLKKTFVHLRAENRLYYGNTSPPHSHQMKTSVCRVGICVRMIIFGETKEDRGCTDMGRDRCKRCRMEGE